MVYNFVRKNGCAQEGIKTKKYTEDNNFNHSNY